MSLLGIIIPLGRAGTLEAFKHTLFVNSFLCRGPSLAFPVLQEELIEYQRYGCFLRLLFGRVHQKKKSGNSMDLNPPCFQLLTRSVYSSTQGLV